MSENVKENDTSTQAGDITIEEQLRGILTRMEIYPASGLSSGDLCELANFACGLHLWQVNQSLLAALKALVLETELCDNPSDEGVPSSCDQMNAARAAIEKAESLHHSYRD